MLLCVCLWVCNLCVKECVFLRSLCQCVCSSNTGFSPYYPHLPLLFSPHFWWLHTNPLSISNWTLFIHPAIILKLPHFPACDLFAPHWLPTSIHPPIHSFPHSPIHCIWFPSPTLLYVSFTSHICSLALPFLSLTLSTRFSSLRPFLSLSLSHSALCLARSGWAAPRWLRVCVHSGACRASPPPGLTTRFCLSPLNSAASPPLPPLLSCAFHRHHYYLPTLHDSSSHLAVDTFTSSPSRFLI